MARRCSSFPPRPAWPTPKRFAAITTISLSAWAGGELVPYASYYLTGFLNEKPLALLRQEMRRLGIERSPDVSEPEDHIAALCEMMAGLVEGAYGDGDPTTASTFFRAHVAAWAPYFFKDLAGTSTSALYAALGQSGRVFIDLEDEADRLFSQQRQAG